MQDFFDGLEGVILNSCVLYWIYFNPSVYVKN